MAKISVIVPIYNVKPYLDECIQSLVSQTYKDIEIILIDDGSQDGSGQICDVWGRKDPRIKVIHTSNEGVSHARNVGLDTATGEYISFIDSDDWIETDMYECMIHALEKNNAELCIGEYRKNFDRVSKIEFQIHEACVLSREDVILYTFNWILPQKKIISWELCDKLFKASNISNIRFDESIYMGEDMLFYWYFLKNINSAVYLPLFKYHYRMRKTSAVHQKLSEKTITGFFVRKEIFKSSKSESKVIHDAVKNLYIVEGIQYTRGMLTLSPVKYKNSIIDFQKFIRRHFFEIFSIRDTSFRVKLGVFYLLLPYFFCKQLGVFIEKK